MKVLLLYDYPPQPSGLSVLGEWVHKGLESLGHTIDPHSLFDPYGIEQKLTQNKYDLSLGVGYWADADREIYLPKYHNIPTAVYWVSEANVAKNKELIPKTDLLITTSEYSQEIFNKFVPDIKDKIKVVYPGIDTEFYKPSGITPTKTFTTFISSGKVKGVEEALTSVMSLKKDGVPPNFKYIIHSPFTEYKLERDFVRHLQELVKEYDISKYVSFVSGTKFAKEKMPILYQTLWFFLAPWRIACYGFPILEAGACEVPSIAGDWKPMNELIVNNETGILVPYMARPQIPKFMEGVWYTEECFLIDTDILADKILDLLNDPEKRRKMGENARKLVLEKFESKQQIKKLEKELLKICQ